MIKLTFYTSGFLIIWAMIGYPISILFLGKLIRRTPKKLEAYEPTVTVMVVAHNEEEVIIDKLNNLLNIDYPKDKLEILVSSDFSTDKTNELVKTFIDNNKDENIRLYITKNRGGKTNAQNEAHKTVESEFIVFTDANAMLKENAVNELMNSFVSEEIIYATGELVYINRNTNETSESENVYWSKEVRIRSIESNIQTITAGNGALYAMKKVDYIDLDPIRSHDAGMPFYAATQRKRAIAVPSAIAYEKAGEVIEDEYKRKVRMNRGIINSMFRTFKVLNVFKYRWFTYFYIGHRGLRSSLWLNHILFLLSNLYLSFNEKFYLIIFIIQLLFYTSGILYSVVNINNKFIKMINYYCVTILAQIHGVYNTITGKNRPFWEKAESTR